MYKIEEEDIFRAKSQNSVKNLTIRAYTGESHAMSLLQTNYQTKGKSSTA